MVLEKSKRNRITNINSTPIHDYEDKMKQTDHGLPEKQFAHRESLYTVLFENPNLKTVHHVAIAVFVVFMTNTILRDYFDNHEVALGFQVLRRGFANLHIALILWVLYFLLTCSTYLCFKIWANVRTKLSPSNKSIRKMWDWSGVLSVIIYYIFSFKLASYSVTTFDLAPASASIVLIEQTRLLFKVHSFVRSNAPRVLAYKSKSENKLNLASFGHFVYFLMAPTLIYRDEYPRTSSIRWKAVLIYALEIFGGIIVYAFIAAGLLMPKYREFGIRKFTTQELFLRVLESSFIGVLLLFTTSYLIFHLVQNFFAEILRFGDRMFYKDWWTASDSNTYFRTWNVVVQDWMYTYIYKDSYEVLVPKNKIFARCLTFLISALMHEWIMMNVLGFLFPFMFIALFGFGIVSMSWREKKTPLKSTLYWIYVLYGGGVLMSGYSIEYFARSNNVLPVNEEYDFYIPRSITCDCYIQYKDYIE